MEDIELTPSLHLVNLELVPNFRGTLLLGLIPSSLYTISFNRFTPLKTTAYGRKERIDSPNIDLFGNKEQVTA